MKKVIRLTESELHRVITETVKRILNEEGGMVGGAAASGSNALGGATNANISSDAEYIAPFGGVQRRKGYSPKGGKSSKMAEVDMSPAMKRHDGKGGSISIPKNHA